MTDSISQPRPAQLASRLLARSARIGDRPASRLARSVRGRHGLAALPTHPRLMPLSDPGRPQVALATSTGFDGESPPAPAVAGMSDFAARWLFGDGQVEGTPFASGAAIPREQAAQLPSFLAARDRSPAPPEAGAATRSTPAVRGQVQEGQPVRLSPVPARGPTVSRGADSQAPHEPLPPPSRPAEEPARVPAEPATQTQTPRESVARGQARIPEPAARGERSRPTPAPIPIKLERTDVEPPARRQPVAIARRTPHAAESTGVEEDVPAIARPPSRWRAGLDRVAATLRPPSPRPAQSTRAATPFVPSRVPEPPHSAPPAADRPAEREPRRPSTPTAPGGHPRPLLRLWRAPAASPVVTTPLAGARRTAGPTPERSADPTGPTAGQRLAGVTGAVVSRERDRDLETIDFGPLARPRATVPLLSPAMSMPGGDGRDTGATADAAPSEAAETTAVAPGETSPAGPGASHAAASPDVDDLYEQVVERLRRDLLFERERMGDLLGDLP
jgi:hypothetical protein